MKKNKDPWNKGKKTGQIPWNKGRKIAYPWDKKYRNKDGETEKQCTKCGEWKKVESYYKDKNRKDGRSCWCKDCDNKNRKKCIEIDREGYLQRYKEYYQKNRKNILEKNRKYREENRQKMLQRRRDEYRRHKEKYAENAKIWAELNKEKRQEISNRYMRKKRLDPMFVLNGNISKGIRRSLEDGKQGKHWEELVDFSLQELRVYLEKTMPEGYNWEDYLVGKLHLDHIIPIDVFNFSGSEHIDFKRCWKLDNLQLLPAKENLRKGSKLNQLFQPSLKV